MGEEIRAYMIMHELCLKEHWVDENGIPHAKPVKAVWRGCEYEFKIFE